VHHILTDFIDRHARKPNRVRKQTHYDTGRLFNAYGIRTSLGEMEHVRPLNGRFVQRLVKECFIGHPAVHPRKEL
jgi:hypothetical protein